MLDRNKFMTFPQEYLLDKWYSKPANRHILIKTRCEKPLWINIGEKKMQKFCICNNEEWLIWQILFGKILYSNYILRLEVKNYLSLCIVIFDSQKKRDLKYSNILFSREKMLWYRVFIQNFWNGKKLSWSYKLNFSL